MRIVYTQEDIYFLIENYQKHGIEYCAIYLGKTKSSIKHKANRLNLRINTELDKKVRTLYTQEDIYFLIENYQKHGVDYCAKYLNKSKCSVLNKANKLKLTFNKKYNTNEERKEGKKLTNKKSREKPENKIKSKETTTKWRENNPEKVKESKINWKKANPEKVKESKRKNYIKYRETKDFKDKTKKRMKNYRKENPYIKAWRSILSDSLRRLGKPKEGNTIDLLGYSALDLQNHIISLFTEGMSWGNHGEWHIDHIKRVSEFDKDTHPSIVNALSNLRPLWATTREINGIIYEGNLNRG